MTGAHGRLYKAILARVEKQTYTTMTTVVRLTLVALPISRTDAATLPLATVIGIIGYGDQLKTYARE
jgi:hypothetical protein